MDDNKKKKISLTTYIISLIVLIAVIIGIVIYFIVSNQNTECDTCERNNINSKNYVLYNNKIPDIEITDKKPIIYLYPTEETQIDVELKNKEIITCSYPKYEDKWQVIAKPTGDLMDITTGRNLYSLYWEGKNKKQYNDEELKEGFCVKGEDTIKFLEEKLEILGLNEREAEEFIIYWLPQMEGNKYNYIRFQTQEEIEENMPLEITPKPDTTIRIMMEFKALDEEIQVKEQKLEKIERKGYTAVEWGGTEII